MTSPVDDQQDGPAPVGEAVTEWVCEHCLTPHDASTVAADGQVCGCGGWLHPIDADGFEVTR